MRRAWMLAALLPGVVVAADPPPESALRERLAERRATIEADHVARERACAQRFFVTGCLEAARSRRREALAEVDLDQANLDDAVRGRRAASRLQRIEEKQARQAADQAQRAAAPLLPAEAASAAVRPAPRLVSPPAVRPPAAGAEEPPVDAARRRRDEQRARAAYETRQKDAVRRREDLQRRQQDKPRAAPLPPVVPASKP